MSRRTLRAIYRAALGIAALYVMLYYIIPVLLLPSKVLEIAVTSIRDRLFLAGLLIITGLAIRSALPENELSRTALTLHVVSLGLIVATVIALVAILGEVIPGFRSYLNYITSVLATVMVLYFSSTMLPAALAIIALTAMVCFNFNMESTLISAPVLAGSIVYAASSYVYRDKQRKSGAVKAGVLTGTLVLLILLYMMTRSRLLQIKPELTPLIDIIVFAISAYLLFGALTSAVQSRSETLSLVEEHIERALREDIGQRDELRELVEDIYRRFVIHGDKKPLVKFIATSGVSSHVLDKALDAVLSYEDQPVPALLPGFLRKIYIKKNIAGRLALFKAIARLLAEEKCSAEEILREVPKLLSSSRRGLQAVAIMLVVLSVLLVLYSLYQSVHGVAVGNILPLCELAVILSLPVPLLVSLSSLDTDRVRTLIRRLCSD